jgi:hypothetical protein
LWKIIGICRGKRYNGMNEALLKSLKGMRNELRVRRKKLEKFEHEVAVNHVIYAINEALKKLKK